MGGDRSFTDVERERAATWKRHTRVLPDEARVPAPYVDKDGRVGTASYDFCLPPEHAVLSLLPEVRDMALDLFAELGIPWHAGVGDGPSNHLLSSQVQCVNALAQMVTDAGRIVRAFGDVLGTVEVLPIEPGRYLTFEYIGPTDFFGEAPGAERTRGARCTSVDAAFLHRTREGLVELVLLEWKYTESYRPRQAEPAKDRTRLRRYGQSLADPQGPVRDDVLDFADLLDEPFYQLMRQQLLAHELEKARAHGVDRVRVVHVLPKRNVAYQQSLRPAHRALGDSVSEVWQQLLRRPDRFVPLDSAFFDDPEISSKEYAPRYGNHPVAGITNGATMPLTGHRSAARPVTAGHERSLDLLSDPVAVRDVLTSYRRALLGAEVYLRPTDGGLKVISLDAAGCRSMIGVGGVGTQEHVLTTVSPTDDFVRRAAAGYFAKRDGLRRASEEERFVRRCIRQALADGLRFPGAGWSFLHQEWRLPTSVGGGKVDLLAIDLAARRLVVIECKSSEAATRVADRSGRDAAAQAAEYASLIHHHRAELYPFFDRLASALHAVYGGSDTLRDLELDPDQPPTTAVWWPGNPMP